MAPVRVSRFQQNLLPTRVGRGYTAFSSATVEDAMKSATICLASSSGYWTGGDFMK